MSGRSTSQEALLRFSRALGIPPISHIVKRGRDPDTARFTIVLEDHREIRVGTTKTFVSQAELGRVIFAAIDTYPEKVKSGDWHDLLRALGATCAITVEEVEGERFEDAVAEMLADYLDTTALGADKPGAAAQGLPFKDNGHTYVSAQHLARYIRREHSEQIKTSELRQALTDLGYERETVMYQKAKKRCSRSYYVGETDSESA